MKNTTILHERDYVCDKSFINTNKNIVYKVPTYKEMMEDQKQFMLNHKDFYDKNYF